MRPQFAIHVEHERRHVLQRDALRGKFLEPEPEARRRVFQPRRLRERGPLEFRETQVRPLGRTLQPPFRQIAVFPGTAHGAVNRAEVDQLDFRARAGARSACRVAGDVTLNRLEGTAREAQFRPAAGACCAQRAAGRGCQRDALAVPGRHLQREPPAFPARDDLSCRRQHGGGTSVVTGKDRPVRVGEDRVRDAQRARLLRSPRRREPVTGQRLRILIEARLRRCRRGGEQGKRGKHPNRIRALKNHCDHVTVSLLFSLESASDGR